MSPITPPADHPMSKAIGNISAAVSGKLADWRAGGPDAFAPRILVGPPFGGTGFALAAIAKAARLLELSVLVVSPKLMHRDRQPLMPEGTTIITPQRVWMERKKANDLLANVDLILLDEASGIGGGSLMDAIVEDAHRAVISMCRGLDDKWAATVARPKSCPVSIILATQERIHRASDEDLQYLLNITDYPGLAFDEFLKTMRQKVRKEASADRQARYRDRLRDTGLKQVLVTVPSAKEDEIKAIAAAMVENNKPSAEGTS